MNNKEIEEFLNRELEARARYMICLTKIIRENIIGDDLSDRDLMVGLFALNYNLNPRDVLDDDTTKDGNAYGLYDDLYIVVKTLYRLMLNNEKIKKNIEEYLRNENLKDNFAEVMSACKQLLGPEKIAILDSAFSIGI